MSGRLSDRQRADRRVTGADLQIQITDLATIFGWTWVHFRPAKTERGWRTPVEGPLGKGWPDLFLLRERDRRAIWAELKREIGDPLTYDQEMVLASLRTLVLDRDDYVRKALSIVAAGSWTASRSEPVRESWTLPLPRIEVFVWRPSDLEQIALVLK